MFLEKFAIENFRLFKESVEFEFRPITILIGANNSGKSTLFKALQLLIQSAKSRQFPFFLSTVVDEADISSASQIFPRDKEKNELAFKLKFFGNSFNMNSLVHQTLMNTELELIFKGSDLAESFELISMMLKRPHIEEELLKHKVYSSTAKSFYEFVSGGYYEVYPKFFEEMGKIISLNRQMLEKVWASFEADFADYTSSDLKDTLSTFMQTTTEEIEIGEFTFERVEGLNIFSLWISIKEIGQKVLEKTDMRLDYLNEVAKFLESLTQENSTKIYTRPGSSLQFSKERSNAFQLIINKGLVEYLDNVKEYFSSNFNSISPFRGAPKMSYTRKDHELIARSVLKNQKNVKAYSYILSEVLKIADGVKIIRNDGDTFSIRVIKNGTEFGIEEMGYGFSQLLPIILNRDLWEPNLFFKPHTWMISEPEANLHPSLQSKLADLFAYLYKEEDSTYLIETHSEYLVRKLQYLVKTGKFNLKREDVIIHYLYHPNDIPINQPQVLKIEIDEEGNLSRNFPPGFYDESSRIALDLWNLNFSQKN